MTLSNLRGSNNQSGLLYRSMNGLRQYQGDKPFLPINPVFNGNLYQNPTNINFLDKTMRDGKDDSVKGGKKKIPDFRNVNLEDGGFLNRGNTMTQTPQGGSLKIPEKYKKLSKGEISGLPIQKDEEMTKQEKSQYSKFLSKPQK